MRSPLVAANWKMHGSIEFVERYVAELEPSAGVDTVLFPPAVFLHEALRQVQQRALTVALGLQDAGTAAEGAHTGEIAPEMIHALGGQWAIVGHSERRLNQEESDDLVATKAAACLRAQIRPIVCVGETLPQREAGQEQEVVARQLDAVLDRTALEALSEGAIGYEPVWAIGTGVTASPAQAQEMHAFIRKRIADVDAQAAERIRIIYGGSVKPGNAAELFAESDIDGGLVGGASLDAQEFSAIIAAANPTG